MEKQDSKERITKTRSRVSRICSTCRKRKTKCDRGRPFCSFCVKNNCTDSCKYEVDVAPPVIKSETLLDHNAALEIRRLKLELNNMKVKFYKQEALMEELKCLSEKRILKFSFPDNKDPSKRHGDLYLKNLRVTYYGCTSSAVFTTADPIISKILERYYSTQRSRYLDVDVRKNVNSFMRTGNIGPLPEDLTRRYEAYSSEMPQLPPIPVIKLLLNRFFKYCIHIAQFIVKDCFFKEVNPFLESKNTYLALLEMDYGTVAMLFIILRFAYLTMIPYHGYPEESYIDQNKDIPPEHLKIEISTSYIEYAKLMIFSGKGMGRLTLTLLQATLLLRFYKTMCPEDDNESSESRLLLNIAIEMARINGLHQWDINIENDIMTPEFVYIRKKIWFTLCLESASLSFDFGAPLCMHPPDEFALVRSLQEENVILKIDDMLYMRQMELCARYAILIRKSIVMLDDIYQYGEYSEKGCLSVFEEFYELMKSTRSFGQLMDNFDSKWVISLDDRVQEFKLRLGCTFKLYVISFTLFLYYDESSESSLSKSDFLTSALENGLTLLKIATGFFLNPFYYFGASYGKMVAISVLYPLSKIIPSLVSLLCRSLNNEYSFVNLVSKFKLPDSPELLQWMDFDLSNNNKTIKNIFKKLNLVYEKCIDLHSQYFILNKIGIFLQYTLGYIQENYSSMLEFNYLENVRLEDNTLPVIERASFDEIISFEANLDVLFDYSLFTSHVSTIS